MVKEKVLGVLACVGGVLGAHSEGLRKALDLRQQVKAALQHVVHAAPLREVLLRVEFRDSAAQSEQVPLGDVQGDDLLEEVVQRLIRVRDEDDLLVGEVVEEKVDHLHRGVGLACARGAYDHREAGVDARADGLDLHGGEADLVLPGLALGVGAHVRQLVRRGYDTLRRSLPRLAGARLRKLEAERPLKILGNVDVLRIWEGLQDVVLIQERIPKIDLRQRGGQLPVLRSAGVAVPEEQVVEPVWHRRVFRGHQASDRLQDGLEVVFLRLPPDNQVQGAVDLPPALGRRLEVRVILRWVEQHPRDPVVADGRLPLRRVRVADNVPFLVQ
mmetsp:Transcript_9026/g.25941  ORF Transcript_9026/g.25941 Transcript_9026/m.25941 type:complete len:329 (-) Transcript_9026:1965-2951(-)